MFGDGLHMSLGKLEMRLPTPDGAFLAMSVDVVSADVPLLLGIDVLDREQLVADNVESGKPTIRLENGYYTPRRTHVRTMEPQAGYVHTYRVKEAT